MKVVLEYEKCIACGACQAVCPKYFELQGEDGKSNLLGAITDKQTKNQELELENLDCIKEAAEACPVHVIQIVE